MFSIVFTQRYTERAQKFLRKHPVLLKQYEKTLQLLELNPYHPSLRLHALQGHLQGIHSISMNLQYRITLHLVVREKEIILLDIGDHDAVYGS